MELPLTKTVNMVVLGKLFRLLRAVPGKSVWGDLKLQTLNSVSITVCFGLATWLAGG